MAWEEESIEGGADFEEVGGKKSPIKMIILVVVASLVLGGGGYFAYSFLVKEETPTEEDSEVLVEEVEPVDETGFKVDLDKFTLNLAGTGSTARFLVAALSLEVSTEELKNDLTQPEDAKLYMVRTRDTILNILRRKTFKEMNDPDISKEIGKEIMFKLNRIYKNGEVKNVYFTELLVQ